VTAKLCNSAIEGHRGNATRWLYAALMLAPFLALAPLMRLMPDAHVGAAILCAPFAFAIVVRFFREPPGRGLNVILARTAQVQLAFAILP
jgi:1,4-dihydroxy-2-naphthoate octaprenyltransferase